MNVLLVIPTIYEAERILFGRQIQLIQGELLLLEEDSSNVSLLITGAGPFLTTYHLGRVLVDNEFDLIIQLGIAGTHDRNILIPSLVQITSDKFIGFGSEDGGDLVGAEELGFYEDDEVLNKIELRSNINLPDLEYSKNIPGMKGVTVFVSTGSIETAEKIRKEHGKVIESMEGASFLFCCLKADVACLQIRAISNIAGPRNKNEWKTEEALDLLKDYVDRNF